ncbi:uncharacterized protein LOC133543081 isoform X1 [Nerophis ophidion]|uniref:uncharacterized protein LOC133543081 isoform X1 n=1 Tax=Nerophis ophidion TaxID=159077 RepID=UPI002AE0AB2B|nr:uncharacterized protein LOC133543081 isoform X1 [Nerophis ophidion]
MYFNCSCSVAPLLRCYINSSAQIMTQRHHWAPREHARVCCEHSVSESNPRFLGGWSCVRQERPLLTVHSDSPSLVLSAARPSSNKPAACQESTHLDLMRGSSVKASRPEEPLPERRYLLMTPLSSVIVPCLSTSIRIHNCLPRSTTSLLRPRPRCLAPAPDILPTHELPLRLAPLDSTKDTTNTHRQQTLVTFTLLILHIVITHSLRVAYTRHVSSKV